MHRHPLIRLLWCLMGAAVGITLALSVVGPPHLPFVLASLGGSTLFLFGLTQAPAAQPRAILVGHLSSAFFGILAFKLLGATLPAYALATSAALAFMLLTRTLHPPAGANTLLMIHAQAGWSALLFPVLAGVSCLMVVAVVWSRLYPGLIRYPERAWAPSPPSSDWGGWRDAGK